MVTDVRVSTLENELDDMQRVKSRLEKSNGELMQRVADLSRQLADGKLTEVAR